VSSIPVPRTLPPVLAMQPISAATATSGVTATTRGVAPRPSLPRACDVLAELKRPLHNTPAPAVLPALLMAALTFGIAPALLWPLRFWRSVRHERRSFLLFAEWARSHTSPEEGRCLTASAGRVGFVPRLFTLGLAGVVAAAGGAAWAFTHSGRGPGVFHRLVGTTYGFEWPRYADARGAGHLTPFLLWTIGLTVAYAAHLVQVQLHARSVRRFLDDCNRFLIEEGSSPVYMVPIGLGFSPLWVVAAVMFSAFSATWGVALAVAGATDRRYRRRASAEVRTSLARGVREIVLLHLGHDSSRVAALASDRTAVRCATPGCNVPLVPGAKFCTRCGRRRDRSIDRRT
jgi:hypothetical protein